MHTLLKQVGVHVITAQVITEDIIQIDFEFQQVKFWRLLVLCISFMWNLAYIDTHSVVISVCEIVYRVLWLLQFKFKFIFVVSSAATGDRRKRVFRWRRRQRRRRRRRRPNTIRTKSLPGFTQA